MNDSAVQELERLRGEWPEQFSPSETRAWIKAVERAENRVMAEHRLLTERVAELEGALLRIAGNPTIGPDQMRSIARAALGDEKELIADQLRQRVSATDVMNGVRARAALREPAAREGRT